MQELGMQTLNAEDRLCREYQSRTDGTKEGIVDRDLTGAEEVIHILGTRSKPIVNFEEETKHVETFVSALNQSTGHGVRPSFKLT